MEANKVKPIILADPETNEEYTLQFSCESVKFAEQRGFKISELFDFPQSNIPDLFYFAFRMHHPKVARNQANKLFEELGGLRVEELDRLIELYKQPQESLLNKEPEERKNCRLTMSL